MKKISSFLLTNIALIFTATSAIASDNTLFGFRFYARADDYLSYSLIRSAERDSQTLRREGFKEIYVENPPIRNSQIENYWVGIDQRDTIHVIKGFTEVDNNRYCLRQAKKWANKLEDRFNQVATFDEFVSGEINIEAYGFSLENGDYISTRCNTYKDGEVYLWVYWQSYQYNEAINEYYDSLERF